MIVVDASTWVSFSLKNDAKNRETTRWVDIYVANSGQLAVPALFLVEIASALVRRTNSLLVAETAVSKIQQERLFVTHAMDDRLIEEATNVALHQRLRGADAIYVALAQRLSVPPVTWDDEQRERGRQVIDVLTPAEALKRLP